MSAVCECTTKYVAHERDFGTDHARTVEALRCASRAPELAPTPSVPARGLRRCVARGSLASSAMARAAGKGETSTCRSSAEGHPCAGPGKGKRPPSTPPRKQ
eukprot:2641237-Pleurochrysis_carterae.AAC.2